MKNPKESRPEDDLWIQTRLLIRFITESRIPVIKSSPSSKKKQKKNSISLISVTGYNDARWFWENKKTYQDSLLVEINDIKYTNDTVLTADTQRKLMK